ncbi:hypothetical protein E3P98_01709 [Wallemia ichthyophaga]|nr:hypothetical protein E3P98_01709 [Wallemia ichthyophaga]
MALWNVVYLLNTFKKVYYTMKLKDLLLKDVDVQDFSIADASIPQPPPPALIAPMASDRPANAQIIVDPSTQIANSKRKHADSSDEADDDSSASMDTEKANDKYRRTARDVNKVKVRSSNNGPVPTPPKPKFKPGEAPREQMKKLTKAEAIWLEGHMGNVYATAFNPKYSNVSASSGADGILKIWTLPAVGREMKGKTLEVIDCSQLKGPPRKGDGRDITTIAWSSDGEMIMTGAYDGSVWIWTRNGDILMEKRVHKGPVFSVKFNKDGTRALTAGLDKRTIVWDIQTFDIEHQWQYHMGSILDADWLDNDILATAGGDRIIYVFKCGDPEPIKALYGHTREVNQVRWDPSGEYLASGSDDATIRVWKFSKEEPYDRRPQPDADCIRVMRGHEREIGCLIWAPQSNFLDKPLLLSGGMDGHRVELMTKINCIRIFVTIALIIISFISPCVPSLTISLAISHHHHQQMNGNPQITKIPPPEGMIYPPPDIRSIVDKTANYVANSPHGALLEEKIREKERSNAKFAFLNSADAYHGYYKWKCDRVKAGDKEDTFGRSAASTPSISQVPSTYPSKPIPKEPLAHEFSADIPDNALAVDLDIIRLTALFTARRGKSFISMLGGRENRNPQFDFLRPNHSLFGLFNNYVEQYMKVIKGTSAPLDDDFDRLSLSEKKKQLVDNANLRAEWESYKRDGLKKREQESEKELAAFQSIDWQDFVVCETIEITPADSVLELPAPLSIKEVRNLAMAQKRMTSLLEEEIITEPSTSTQDVNMEAAPQQGQGHVPQQYTPQPTAQAPIAPEGMKIKTNYVPKSQKQQQQIPQGFSRSPISGALVPNEEFANHLRIELLDPKWQEKKEYAESRRQASVLLQQGADVASSLKNLAQGRTDIFGQDREKAELRRKEAEAAAQDVKRRKEAGVWDGHTASADSISQRYQAQADSEVQAERINQTLGINQAPQATTAGPQINSYGNMYDPSGATMSAAPSGPSVPKFHMPHSGNVRTADEAEMEPFAVKSKRAKVQKLPEGQYYTEDEWMDYHPAGQVTLKVQLPLDQSNSEWGLDGSIVQLSPTPLTAMSGVIREHISEALEDKNGAGKRGPPIGRMKLDFGNITLSNSKTIASYNLDDGDQIKLSVRQGKKYGLSVFGEETYGFMPSGLRGFFFGSLASATLKVISVDVGCLEVRWKKTAIIAKGKMNETVIWKSGALLAATGIGFGAFGAHGLRARAGIQPRQIESWMTGSHYAVFNGLALMATSLHPRASKSKFAAPAILTGSLLFSGSIYALVLNRDKFKFLGPVTPLGGLSMILG